MAIKVGEKDLFPYLGDYGPVSIYKGEQKLAGYKWAEKSGQELHFDNTYNSSVEVEVDGQSYQESDEPTPDSPIEIHSLNDFDVVSSVEKLSEGQLQEYDYGVEYENIDKINLLLSEPLRSVGDVHDRLFRDSDGLWRIERNVGEAVFDGSEDWGVWHSRDTSAMFGLRSGHLEEPMLKTSGLVVSNMFPSMNINSSDEEGINIGTQPRLRVRAFYERVGTTLNSTKDEKINSFKQWLSNIYTEGVPLTIVYEVETPVIEILDQELQDQLNTLKSFKGSNYVYTVQNTDNLHKEELTPTLHAKTEVKDI